MISQADTRWAKHSSLKQKLLISCASKIQILFIFHTICISSLELSHKVQKLGALKKQKRILSRFRRLKVWNQGVSRAMLSLKALGEDPFLRLLGVPWLRDASLQFHGYLLPTCLPIIIPLCVSIFVSTFPLFIRIRAHSNGLIWIWLPL